jgi:hypothetical protein
MKPVWKMEKVHELTLIVKFFKWIGFSTTSSNGVAIIFSSN